MKSHYPQKKITLVGGGIIAALEAYFAYLDAKKQKIKLRVTVNEKNKNLTETTTSNIVPSLTPDEIMCVVPRGPALVEKLGILFSLPGGIRVDDVKGVNNSAAEKFKAAVKKYSEDEAGHKAREKALLELGKMSMDLWQSIYDNADAELKKILEESNFNPCREPKNVGPRALHDGYRIDIIYNVPNAKDQAEGMKRDYEGLGYSNCKILSPAEVKAMDPSLADFCDSHSEMSAVGERQWKNNSVALYRPGGCLDTGVFLPKFYTYLEKVMGKYVNDEGKIKNCFRLKFDRPVTGVTYDRSQAHINGLKLANNTVKKNKHQYKQSDYVFCPGMSVGTLKNLGLNEPAYSGFAGASLRLNIEIPADKLKLYSKFGHCMEVHQEGVVLAWQARFKNNKIFIGVAGTKAFYSDQQPHKDQEFAKNRNLLQLNMINDVLPEFISLALGRDTKGQKLTEVDLKYLEDHKIAQRWVGVRAVAYDGFPTLGHAYHKGQKISNARITTHLGSGGVSFAPAAVTVSRAVLGKKPNSNALIKDVLKYSSAKRTAVPVVKTVKTASATTMLSKFANNPALKWIPSGANSEFNRVAKENHEQRTKLLVCKR